MVRRPHIGEKRKIEGKMFTLLEICPSRQHSVSKKYVDRGYTHFKMVSEGGLGQWYLYGWKGSKKYMEGR